LRQKPSTDGTISDLRVAKKGRIRKIPCKIPCYQGKQAEHGATFTASPASQPVRVREIYVSMSRRCLPFAGFLRLTKNLRVPN
jgi:hypothetical protein